MKPKPAATNEKATKTQAGWPMKARASKHCGSYAHGTCLVTNQTEKRPSTQKMHRPPLSPLLLLRNVLYYHSSRISRAISGDFLDLRILPILGTQRTYILGTEPPLDAVQMEHVAAAAEGD